jgi:molecular chaperone DnaJ
MPLSGVKTFYDILGVTKDASQADLRKAWLSLARKYHPDKTGGHKGSEEKLKVINEAYDTLKRPEKRKLYDETLSESSEAGAPSGAGAMYGGAPHYGPSQAENFEFDADYTDFWDELFGPKTRGRKPEPRHGRNLEAQTSISQKEAVTGTKKSFRLPSMVLCKACSGSGTAAGTKLHPCPKCKGAGHISGGRGSLFVMSQRCPLCRGRGEVIVTPCSACGGSGFKTETRILSVVIPSGVQTGTRLRLAGQGEPGEPGAIRGDLFVVITVKENDLFSRKRNDIICEAPITFTQAALGGAVEVPTLRGKALVTIPAGTQSGAILRMRGQGFAPQNGGRNGDQLVKVIVEIPRKLTHDQVEAIHNLREDDNMDSYPKHHAFVENIKRWCES